MSFSLRTLRILTARSSLTRSTSIRPMRVDEALKRIDARLDTFGLDLVLMVYSTKMSVAEYPPSASLCRLDALRTGLEAMRRGEILGVTTYAMAKEFEKEQCGFANHLNLTVPSEVPTKTGDFVSAGQTVRLDPSAGRYQASVLRAGLLSSRDRRLPLQAITDRRDRSSGTRMSHPTTRSHGSSERLISHRTSKGSPAPS